MKFLLMLVLINPNTGAESFVKHSEYASKEACKAISISVDNSYCVADYLVIKN